jgi:hypothetical protein
VLRAPCVREGEWRLLECAPAWDGNRTADCFIASCWEGDGARRLVAVNCAPNRSQCYVRLPSGDLAGRTARLTDLMRVERYDRDGSDLAARGLYLDLPPWGYNVFDVATA